MILLHSRNTFYNKAIRNSEHPIGLMQVSTNFFFGGVGDGGGGQIYLTKLLNHLICLNTLLQIGQRQKFNFFVCLRCFKLNHSQVFNVDIFILYFPIHVYNKQNCNKYLLYWMLNSLVCVFVSYFIHLGLLHRSLYYKGLNFHISPILWVLNRLTAIWHKNNSLGSK